MTPLRTLQRDIAASALCDDSCGSEAHVRSDGIDAVRRLNVHRNNTTITLTEALGATFPVVRKLVGDEFFAFMARAFIRQSPPQPGPLFQYGGAFPAFIATFDAAASLPYLPDVARLEWARNRAYFAADVDPLDPRALSGIPEYALTSLTFRFHPSHRFVASAYPVDRIWQANQPGSEIPEVVLSGDAKLLVVRHHRDVAQFTLSEGDFGFLISLATGQTVAVAAQSAGASNVDVAALMGTLLSTGVFTGFELRTKE